MSPTEGYSFPVTPQEEEIAKFLFAQCDKLTLCELKEQDLRRRMSPNTALLLLRTFEKDYFQESECLAEITQILFAIYLKELSTRANKEIAHSTYLFKLPVGYSTREKMEGAIVLKEIQSKNHSKKDLLALLKPYAVLINGTLGKLFDAFLQVAPSTIQHANTTDEQTVYMGIATPSY